MARMDEPTNDDGLAREGMWTIEEASYFSSIPQKTLVRMCREGVIPAMDLGSGRALGWRISKVGLRRYLEAQLAPEPEAA